MNDMVLLLLVMSWYIGDIEWWLIDVDCLVTLHDNFWATLYHDWLVTGYDD